MAAVACAQSFPCGDATCKVAADSIDCDGERFVTRGRWAQLAQRAHAALSQCHVDSVAGAEAWRTALGADCACQQPLAEEGVPCTRAHLLQASVRERVELWQDEYRTRMERARVALEALVIEADTALEILDEGQDAPALDDLGAECGIATPTPALQASWTHKGDQPHLAAASASASASTTQLDEG